ncbi:PEPxxWA-CTERM sorting domain-containing protein [Sandaracinobacteroides sp. A072]|uniref:PEPxxWA-CTERM sorting domain-containing protein n=1 Tax=Sandaracinobacteroides sp. A072 TaxID=3461146 RepID=UPI004043818C
MIRTLKLAAAAAVLSAGLMAAPASAMTTITFAQFFQAPGGELHPFNHVGGDGGATLNAELPTVFAVLDFGPLGIYSADLTLNASSSGQVIDTGPQFEQTGWSGVLNFTDGAINVLTVNFTSGVLNVSKDPQNQSASLVVSGLCGSSLCYSSDVLAVADLVVNNFALSFSGVENYTDVGGNWMAAGTGTFAGAVPEPQTWALLIAGFGMVGFVARRRRMSVVSA